MARVRSVGVIATLGTPPVDEIPDPIPNALMWHFARLDSGYLVIDALQQSAMTLQPSIRTIEDLEAALTHYTWDQMPQEIRRGFWIGLLERLADDFGIDTDAETLQSLPFEVVADQPLRGFLERQSG